METTNNHYAEAAMLIRKPVPEVFNAFVDPEVTTKIWFTKSSGKLEAGKHIDWTWEMFNHTVSVKVLELVSNEKIVIQWGADPEAIVTWTFRPSGEAHTFVSIVNRGFKGNSEELISQIRDATGGFSWVLAGLKAYLEYEIELNLIADRYPKA